MKVDTNDAALLGQLRERWAEHSGREESAVKQQQGLTLAVDLEPVVHTVSGDVSAGVCFHRIVLALCR